MSTRTFLHCADLHLDSPLRGLSRYDGAPVDDIRGATRRAFAATVDEAVQRSVTAVLIAGDLFDGERDDFNTAVFLQQQLRRLADADIPVCIVWGNHDAASAITKRLDPPRGVTVLSSNGAETVELSDAGLAVHGRSFAQKAESSDLSATYPPPIGGVLNIGLLHTALAGHEGVHQRYAPCTPQGLAGRGYQYWALGHVHTRMAQQVGDAWLVYPGNPQGRHARELGPRGVTLVDYDGDAVTAVTPLDVDVVRWAEVKVAVTNSSIGDLSEAVREAAINCRDAADGRLVAVRVQLECSATVADDVTSRWAEVEAQIRGDAGSLEGVWLERVRVVVAAREATTVSAGAPALDPQSGDVAAAVSEALERLRSDAAFRAVMVAKLDPLRSKLGAKTAQLRDRDFAVPDDQGVRDLVDAIGRRLLTTVPIEVDP